MRDISISRLQTFTYTLKIFCGGALQITLQNPKNYCLSGPLNRLNAILSLLHPPRPLQEPLCDRDCDWKALFRPISHIHTQVGVVNRLVLNHLGSSTARLWCCLCLPLNQQKGRQTTQAHLPYASIVPSAASDVETVILEIMAVVSVEGRCQGCEKHKAENTVWNCHAPIWALHFSMCGSRPLHESGRAPNDTDTHKELKWTKSDSKVTRADWPQSDLKLTQKWLQTPFSSHFWATFESLPRESLLSHLNSFQVLIQLGARPILDSRSLRACVCVCVSVGYTCANCGFAGISVPSLEEQKSKQQNPVNVGGGPSSLVGKKIDVNSDRSSRCLFGHCRALPRWTQVPIFSMKKVHSIAIAEWVICSKVKHQLRGVHPHFCTLYA